MRLRLAVTGGAIVSSLFVAVVLSARAESPDVAPPASRPGIATPAPPSSEEHQSPQQPSQQPAAPQTSAQQQAAELQPSPPAPSAPQPQPQPATTPPPAPRPKSVAVPPVAAPEPFPVPLPGGFTGTTVIKAPPAIGTTVPEAKTAISGFVLNEAGIPVAGARIDIGGVTPRSGAENLSPLRHPDSAKWCMSDEKGQFSIPDLDPMCKYQLLCTAPGKGAQIRNSTSASSTVLIQLGPPPAADVPAIRGRVVDGAGAPIAGALIDIEGVIQGSSRFYGGLNGVQAVSDVEGRFVMPIDGAYSSVGLKIDADGFAGADFSPVDVGAPARDFVLPLGASVKGTLTADGKPLPHFTVSVVQIDHSMDNHFIHTLESVTDDEGRFAFEHLPADEQYALFSPLRPTVRQGASDETVIYSYRGAAGNTYVVRPVAAKDQVILPTKRFRAPADGKARDLGPLATGAGLELVGRVALPAGKTAPKKARLRLQRTAASDYADIPVDAEGRFEISGLAPESYIIEVLYKGYQIDCDQLNYQVLDDTEMGIRITESIEDLKIPLKSAKAE